MYKHTLQYTGILPIQIRQVAAKCIQPNSPKFWVVQCLAEKGVYCKLENLIGKISSDKLVHVKILYLKNIAEQSTPCLNSFTMNSRIQS